MTMAGILQNLLKPIRAPPINTSTVALTRVPFLRRDKIILNIKHAQSMSQKKKHGSYSPSVFGNQPAHQQGTDHPANSKDGHSEGVQDSDEVLVWNTPVVFNKCFIVELFYVLGKKTTTATTT